MPALIMPLRIEGLLDEGPMVQTILVRCLGSITFPSRPPWLGYALSRMAGSFRRMILSTSAFLDSISSRFAASRLSLMRGSVLEARRLNHHDGVIDAQAVQVVLLSRPCTAPPGPCRCPPYRVTCMLISPVAEYFFNGAMSVETGVFFRARRLSIWIMANIALSVKPASLK